MNFLKSILITTFLLMVLSTFALASPECRNVKQSLEVLSLDLKIAKTIRIGGDMGKALIFVFNKGKPDDVEALKGDAFIISLADQRMHLVTGINRQGLICGAYVIVPGPQLVAMISAAVITMLYLPDKTKIPTKLKAPEVAV